MSDRHPPQDSNHPLAPGADVTDRPTLDARRPFRPLHGEEGGHDLDPNSVKELEADEDVIDAVFENLTAPRSRQSDLELGSAPIEHRTSGEFEQSVAMEMETLRPEPESEEQDEEFSATEGPELEIYGELPRLSSLPRARSSRPSLWPDERASHEFLLDASQHRAWAARAEWLESEALATEDPPGKSRGLLAASEIWALLGDTGRARELAIAASSVGRSLGVVNRQLRWLAAVEGDWKAALPLLDIEARVSEKAEARAHAAYLAAEVCRLVLGDPIQAQKRREFAIRARPEDPRAPLLKFCELLAKNREIPHFRWPETPGLSGLAQATEELFELRSESNGTAPMTANVLFEQARRALASGMRTEAAGLIQAFSELDEIGGGASWLAATLLGSEPTTRPDAIALLKERVQRKDSRAARRALARRALEARDPIALQEALDSSQSESAFSSAERVVLNTLMGAQPPELSGLLSELSTHPHLRPLAAAIAALSADPELASSASAGGELHRTALELGRHLARVGTAALAPDNSWFEKPLSAFEKAHPEHPLGPALRLELAIQWQLRSAVAGRIAEWHSEDPRVERDRQLLAALLYELSGEREAAQVAYRQALNLDAKFEAAARALLVDAQPLHQAQLLSESAEVLGDCPEAAWPLLEAALRRGADDPENYEATLRRAAELAPDLVIAQRLGEESARKQGDVTKLIEWLRLRRQSSQDPIERGLLSVREALLLAESDGLAAATLLADASADCPRDIALRELHERLAQSNEAERAAWRAEAAEHTRDPNRVRLLLQAALESERAADFAAAAGSALRAAELEGGGYGRLLAERNAQKQPSLGDLEQALSQALEHAPNGSSQIELYQRLCALLNAAGDTAKALRYKEAILTQTPSHLPTLRELEHNEISEQREQALEPHARALAAVLKDNEGRAHARLAERLSVRRGGESQRYQLAKLASQGQQRPLWALRTLFAHAQASHDAEQILALAEELYARVQRPLDKATLALQAAGAAAELGRFDRAQQLLHRCLEVVPGHPVALGQLVDVLSALGEHREAATSSEALADVSAVGQHQVEAWYRAGMLWLDQVGDRERGCFALEQAVSLELWHDQAADRLQRLYAENSEWHKQARLLERRLERASDPEQRIALEIARSRALAELGERTRAKDALIAALETNPDHLDALSAFAELCLSQEDWQGAEQAWIRLARLSAEPLQKAHVYRKLGELYQTALPNPERAELIYCEVLKHDPDDTETVSRLVNIYASLDKVEAAVALHQAHLERARTPEEKRDRLLALGLTYEKLCNDHKNAEAIFDRARKEWPYDSKVLKTLAGFLDRVGEGRTLQLLLTRAVNDARRALSTGRFEPAFFELLHAVAELRAGGDALEVTGATLSALHGEPDALSGSGISAADPELDELLAPDLVGPALRALLKRSGDILERAFPLELEASGAEPLEAGYTDLWSRARELAQAFQIVDLELFLAHQPSAGYLAVAAAPSRIVLGKTWLEIESRAVRDFVLFRNLKLLQAHASALSRTAPVDLWPVVAAYLSVFAPNWQPQGLDARRVQDARQRIQKVLPPKFEDDVPALALEVIGLIGSRASQLGTALHQWANRCALLGVGSPSVALHAIVLAQGGQATLPTEGLERARWIARNAEARDVLVYGVSEPYLEARKRVLSVG